MDTTELLELLESKERQNAKLTEALRTQQLLIEKLQVQLESLLRILYGKKSEKKKVTEEDNKEKKDNPNKNANKTDSSSHNGTGRKRLPENIEREIIKYELPESARICKLCGNICHCIGKEISEQ